MYCTCGCKLSTSLSGIKSRFGLGNVNITIVKRNQFVLEETHILKWVYTSQVYRNEQTQYQNRLGAWEGEGSSFHMNAWLDMANWELIMFLIRNVEDAVFAHSLIRHTGAFLVAILLWSPHTKKIFKKN